MSAFYDGYDLSIIEGTAVSKYFGKIKETKNASVSTEENNKPETIVLAQQDFKTEAIYHSESTVRSALLVDSDGEVSRHGSAGTRYLLIIKAKYLSITPEMVREAHTTGHRIDLLYDRLLSACIQYFQKTHTGKEEFNISTQAVAIAVSQELTQSSDFEFSNNIAKVAKESGLKLIPTKLGERAILVPKVELKEDHNPEYPSNKF